LYSFSNTSLGSHSYILYGYVLKSCNLQGLHCLEATRELRAEREASALAGCEADGRREEVEDREDDRGDCRDDDDFLNIRDLAGDDDHRNRNGEALQEVLDGACQELSCRETVHIVLYSGLTIYLCGK